MRCCPELFAVYLLPDVVEAASEWFDERGNFQTPNTEEAPVSGAVTTTTTTTPTAQAAGAASAVTAPQPSASHPLGAIPGVGLPSMATVELVAVVGSALVAYEAYTGEIRGAARVACRWLSGGRGQSRG